MSDPLHHAVDLDLEPQEASGLVASGSVELKDRLGMDPLYWTVLDDGPVERCVALIGQAAGTEEPTARWGSNHLVATITTPTGPTDDGEAIALHDGWVYVLGSAYGSKEGPLEAARNFVARFHESDVTVDEDGRPTADLHVSADPFVLHRVVNDALHAAGVDLMAWSPKFLRKTLGKARKQAIGDEQPWSWRLAHDDSPVNIEGAAFTEDGSLLLGLRVPVTRMGQAMVVEVHHPERLFDPATEDPEPGRVVVLDGVGSRAAPVGVRDLHLADGRLHALLGNLDSDPDDSILLDQHPEGGVAESVHVVGDLPGRLEARAVVQAMDIEVVHRFDGLFRVEGLAADAKGRFLYVSDEDNTVRTRFFTPGSTSVVADG